jgi:hypothetical protein
MVSVTFTFIHSAGGGASGGGGRVGSNPLPPLIGSVLTNEVNNHARLGWREMYGLANLAAS